MNYSVNIEFGGLLIYGHISGKGQNGPRVPVLGRFQLPTSKFQLALAVSHQCVYALYGVPRSHTVSLLLRCDCRLGTSAFFPPSLPPEWCSQHARRVALLALSAMKKGANSGKQQRLKLKVARSTQRSTTTRTAGSNVTIEHEAAHDFRLKGVPTDLFTVFHVREAQYEVDKRVNAARQPLPARLDMQTSDGQLYQETISIPLRPAWSSSMKAKHVQQQEEAAFEAYLEDIYRRYPPHRLNHFEHNINVWRQLWRVCEMADALLLSADARHPLFHFPPSLYQYVTVTLAKPLVLVVNKVDLVDADTLHGWVRYFRWKYPAVRVVCFSSFANGQRVVSERLDVEQRVKERRRETGKSKDVSGVKEVMEMLEQMADEKQGKAIAAAKKRQQGKEGQSDASRADTGPTARRGRARAREAVDDEEEATEAKGQPIEHKQGEGEREEREAEQPTVGADDDAAHNEDSLGLPVRTTVRARRLQRAGRAEAAPQQTAGEGAEQADKEENDVEEEDEQDELYNLRPASTRPSRDSILVVGVIGHPNAGKCFARGTRLRLYNGDTIAVEDVVGGEQLMGDDGLPRIVTPGTLIHHIPRAVREEGEAEEVLYRITPTWDGASPLTVNGAHILVVSNSCKPQMQKQSDSGRWKVTRWEVSTDNRMVMLSSTFRSAVLAQSKLDSLLRAWEPLEWEVSVEEFLQCSAATRHRCKLIACKAITFHNPLLPSLHTMLTRVLGVPPSSAQLDYMAWWLGMWMTSGRSECASVCCQGGTAQAEPQQHYEIVARLLDYQQLFDEPVVQAFDNVCTAGSPVFEYGADSVTDRVLRAYGLLNNKHMPRALVCDSLDVRRRLLAGLIDGAGCYDQPANEYEMQAKQRHVVDGYKELAATLGLRNSGVQLHDYTNKQTGEQYRCYRVSISGQMWDVIQHCAATYKQCSQLGAVGCADQNEASRCYGFDVTEVGAGEYFGFAVHGGANRRFLLEDYTVTHNVCPSRHSSHHSHLTL